MHSKRTEIHYLLSERAVAPKVYYGRRFIMRLGMISETKKIGKILLSALVLMIAGLSGSNVFALDMMGSPTAELEVNMFSGGLEYSLSKMDVDLIEGDLDLFQNGTFQTGPVESITIKDLKVNTLYANIGYGIFENYEVFVRMGAAHGNFGDSLWNEREEFDNNYNFAIGAGAKATFYEGFDWKIGGVFQINRTELDGDIDSSSWPVIQPQRVEISTTEMQIAIGMNYLYSSRVSFYGGPFVHFINGDFDYKFTRITGTFDTGEYTWEIKEGPTYGGYIGAQIKLPKNSSANFEYQKTSDASLFGASIMISY